jgi:hypothetical protein
VPVAISIYNEFSDYMIFKGIKNIDIKQFNYKNIDVDITEDLIIDQFRAMHTFHEKSSGFSGYLRNRLNNNTGKVVEEYKVYIRKLAADMNKIKRDGPKNSFEKLIMIHGKKVITRAEECISAAYLSDYIGIIKRSMRRGEICLGNTDFSNLCKSDFTYVVSFEDCSYNMVEIDCLLLLNKLNRKGVKLDFKRLVDEFCNIEGLDDSSSKFLIALTSYPHEFMKCCNRYREGKKQWPESKFSEKLIKALMQDGESLL